MSDEQRDKLVLKKIVRYCDEAGEMAVQCGNTEEAFLNDRTSRYAIAMCLMQIGELSGRLSDEARCQMSVISWNMIRGMRNILAHDYVNVDWNTIWKTVVMDLPALRLVCDNYLKG